jgi:hypothetical protein
MGPLCFGPLVHGGCRCVFFQKLGRTAELWIPSTSRPGRYPHSPQRQSPDLAFPYSTAHIAVRWYIISLTLSSHHGQLECPSVHRSGCVRRRLLRLTIKFDRHSFHTSQSFLSGFCWTGQMMELQRPVCLLFSQRKTRIYHIKGAAGI